MSCELYNFFNLNVSILSVCTVCCLNIVGTVIRFWTEWPVSGFRFQREAQIYLLYMASSPTLRSIQLPVIWVPWNIIDRYTSIECQGVELCCYTPLRLYNSVHKLSTWIELYLLLTNVLCRNVHQVMLFKTVWATFCLVVFTALMLNIKFARIIIFRRLVISYGLLGGVYCFFLRLTQEECHRELL